MAVLGAGEHRAHDRDLAHVLHATGDDEVGGARHHTLGGEVHGLLRRTALTVDGGAGNVLREPGCQPARAGDVARLRADAVDVAEDHVVDRAGIDARALDERADRVRAEIGRVHRGQPAPRRPTGVRTASMMYASAMTAVLYLLTITDDP